MTHIDSERIVLRIHEAKGNRDRLAMLSPDLLKLLRQWWQYGRDHNLIYKGGWVFPGQHPALKRTQLMFDLRQGYVLRTRAGMSIEEMNDDFEDKAKMVSSYNN